jgi:amidase
MVPVTVDTTGQPASILDYEFKRDLNAYLDRLPDSAPMQSMADIIAFNQAHAQTALKFGQSQFLESQAFDVTPGSADTVKYEADKAAGLAWAQSRIDTALTRGTADPADDLTSIVYANSGSAGIGARATYPSIVVPSGYQPTTRRPAGLSFLGGAYSEAILIGLAYDFEQAAQAWKPAAEINPSLFRCVEKKTAPISCAP